MKNITLTALLSHAKRMENIYCNAAFIRIILLFTVFIFAPCSVDADVIMSNIKMYGHYVGEDRVVYYINNKGVSLPKGIEAVMEFMGINDEESLPVDLIDIETSFEKTNDYSREAVIATLEIYAKTVPFIFRHDVPREPIFDITQMQQDAKWEKETLVSVIAYPMQEERSQVTILFRNIKLRKMLEQYTAKNIWPTEFKFRIVVRMKNETIGSIMHVLKIPIPPY